MDNSISPEVLDSLVAGLKKSGVNTPLNGFVPSGIRPLGFRNASASFRNASAMLPQNRTLAMVNYSRKTARASCHA